MINPWLFPPTPKPVLRTGFLLTDLGLPPERNVNQ